MPRPKKNTLPPHTDDAASATAVAEPPPTKPERRSILPGTAPMDYAPETPAVDPDQLAMFPDRNLQMIAITDIDRQNNHRHQATVDPEKLQQLADSIGDIGLMQPIRVYERQPEGQREGIPPYLLGYGFRRTAATEMLGLTHILAEVCPPAPAADIQQVRALENLARQDLNLLEEMQAVIQLVEACGRDEAMAAGKLGRPLRWVRDRLYLDRLAPKVREKVASGEINLGHARELAKLVDHRQQLDIIHLYQHRRLNIGLPDNVFKGDVARRLRTLRGITWKAEEPFAGKPACSGCPHNSANNLELFEVDPETKASPTCASAECYGIKVKAAEKLLTKAIKSVAGDVVDGKLSLPIARAKAPEGIRPEAVISEVRREASPSKYAAKSGNKGETAEQKRERQARVKYDEACAAWREAQNAAWLEALRTDPLRAVALHLYDGIYGLDEAQSKSLFAMALKATPKAIVELARHWIESQSTWNLRGLVRRLSDEKNLAIQKDWGIKVPDAPKLEDFLPPPEAAKPAQDKPTKGKKRGKGATAQATATKPRKPSRKGKTAAAGMDLDDSDGSDE